KNVFIKHGVACGELRSDTEKRTLLWNGTALRIENARRNVCIKIVQTAQMVFNPIWVYTHVIFGKSYNTSGGFFNSCISGKPQCGFTLWDVMDFHIVILTENLLKRLGLIYYKYLKVFIGLFFKIS